MHRAVCLFKSRLSLVLVALTPGGMAELSLPVWLVNVPTDIFCASADGYPPGSALVNTSRVVG